MHSHWEDKDSSALFAGRGMWGPENDVMCYATSRILRFLSQMSLNVGAGAKKCSRDIKYHPLRCQAFTTSLILAHKAM